MPSYALRILQIIRHHFSLFEVLVCLFVPFFPFPLDQKKFNLNAEFVPFGLNTLKRKLYNKTPEVTIWFVLRKREPFFF